mmetsp:Transcript_91047/g.243736  ORF Transcript_91047/g.243736 Transcript_91047/m.243736 type:complete len:205 (+) Transcript_91047:810-1424(+)
MLRNEPSGTGIQAVENDRQVKVATAGSAELREFWKLDLASPARVHLKKNELARVLGATVSVRGGSRAAGSFHPNTPLPEAGERLPSPEIDLLQGGIVGVVAVQALPQKLQVPLVADLSSHLAEALPRHRHSRPGVQGSAPGPHRVAEPRDQIGEEFVSRDMKLYILILAPLHTLCSLLLALGDDGAVRVENQPSLERIVFQGGE